jgi:predicted transcriptional regulator
MSRKLPKEIIEDIRKEVLSGKSNYEVAQELGISETTVRNHTKDIARPKNIGPCIKKEQFELFKQLLENGYVYSDSNRNHLRGLQKHFPMIKRANYKGRSLYFLEDYSKTALNAMIQQKESRVISYHDLSNMSRIFDVKLSPKEKKEVCLSSSSD